MNHKVLLFIPAYNCAAQLPRVLAQVYASIDCGLFHQTLVLDNVSRDATLVEAKAYLATHHIPNLVLGKNITNLGLGGSLKVAFDYAIDGGFSHVVVLHGDDQAALNDILPACRDRALMEESDIIIGARFHPNSICEGYSWVRQVGNQVLNRLCSVVLKRKIYDLIAGLNIFSVRFLRSRFYSDFPNDLTFDFHLLLHAALSGRVLHFIPIRWREEDQVSNAKAVRQGLRILSMLFAAVCGKRTVVSSTSPVMCGKEEIKLQVDLPFSIEYQSFSDGATCHSS